MRARLFQIMTKVTYYMPRKIPGKNPRKLNLAKENMVLIKKIKDLQAENAQLKQTIFAMSDTGTSKPDNAEKIQTLKEAMAEQLKSDQEVQA